MGPKRMFGDFEPSAGEMRFELAFGVLALVSLLFWRLRIPNKDGSRAVWYMQEKPFDADSVSRMRAN